MKDWIDDKMLVILGLILIAIDEHSWATARAEHGDIEPDCFWSARCCRWKGYSC